MAESTAWRRLMRSRVSLFMPQPDRHRWQREADEHTAWYRLGSDSTRMAGRTSLWLFLRMRARSDHGDWPLPNVLRHTAGGAGADQEVIEVSGGRVAGPDH